MLYTQILNIVKSLSSGYLKNKNKYKITWCHWNQSLDINGVYCHFYL